MERQKGQRTAVARLTCRKQRTALPRKDLLQCWTFLTLKPQQERRGKGQRSSPEEGLLDKGKKSSLVSSLLRSH